MLKTGIAPCARELLDGRLRPGAHADRVDVAREHERGVAQRLAARELQLVAAQDQRMPAELDDADLEGQPRARRGLLEDQRDRPLRERVGAARRALQLERAVEQRVELGCVELGAGEEMAGHGLRAGRGGRQ